MGKCQGQLVVSEKGLAFVPERKDREDAFSLKHTQFQHTVDGTTLTIRAARRTYRFSVTGTASAPESQVKRLAEAIRRSAIGT
jgi:hypothetical protein